MSARPAAHKRRTAKKPVRRAIQSFARAAYRQAILDAAEAVFARLGFHQAKMTDVAAEAGVSIGTLYNHFGSKELIFASLVERGSGEIVRELDKAAKSADPELRLLALVETVLSFLEERGALFDIYRQLGALSESDIVRVGGQRAEKTYVEALELFTSAIAEASKRGRLRSDLPATVLAAALTGSINAAIFDWVRTGRKQSLKARAASILELFVKGAGPQ